MPGTVGGSPERGKKKLSEIDQEGPRDQKTSKLQSRRTPGKEEKPRRKQCRGRTRRTSQGGNSKKSSLGLEKKKPPRGRGLGSKKKKKDTLIQNASPNKQTRNEQPKRPSRKKPWSPLKGKKLKLKKKKAQTKKNRPKKDEGRTPG